MEDDMSGLRKGSEDEVMKEDRSESEEESNSDAVDSDGGEVEVIEPEEQDSEEEIFGDEETMEGEHGYGVM